MPLSPGPIDFPIRRLRAGDEERLSAFYDALSERSRSFFQPYEDTSPEAMAQVVARAIEGEDLGLVAVGREDEVIAHAFVMDVAREVPHLGIGLRDEHHGQGLGTALLAHLLSLSRRELGNRRLGLTVVKRNTRAIRLYVKLGFEIVRDDVTFRSEHDSYEMQVSLGAEETGCPNE